MQNFKVNDQLVSSEDRVETDRQMEVSALPPTLMQSVKIAIDEHKMSVQNAYTV